MRVLLLLCLSVLPRAPCAQIVSADARALALAGAGTALAGPHPVNPAGHAGGGSIRIGSSRLYGIPALTPFRLGWTGSGRTWRPGLGMHGLVVDEFSSIAATLDVAAATGRPDVGLRLQVVRTRAGPTPVHRSAVATAGARWSPSPTLSAGAQLRTRLWGSDLPETEPSLRVGIAWSTDLLVVPVDLERTAARRVLLRVGIEARPVETVVLRAGVARDRPAAGIGLTLGRMRADVGADRHPWLGWSVGIDIILWTDP